MGFAAHNLVTKPTAIWQVGKGNRMANQRLFLDNEVACPARVGNSMSTKYTFVEGKLTIYWGGIPMREQKASIGDAYIVVCDGSTPEVKPLKAPKDAPNLILWLVGYPKPLRAFTEAEFDELYKTSKEANSWWGYRDWCYEGDGWKAADCNRSDCGGICRLAAFIDPAKFTTAVAKEILNGTDVRPKCSRAYAAKQLRRIGFTDKDLEEVLPAMFPSA